MKTIWETTHGSIEITNLNYCLKWGAPVLWRRNSISQCAHFIYIYTCMYGNSNIVFPSWMICPVLSGIWHWQKLSGWWHEWCTLAKNVLNWPIDLSLLLSLPLPLPLSLSLSFSLLFLTGSRQVGPLLPCTRTSRTLVYLAWRLQRLRRYWRGQRL